MVGYVGATCSYTDYSIFFIRAAVLWNLGGPPFSHTQSILGAIVAIVGLFRILNTLCPL